MSCIMAVHMISFVVVLFCLQVLLLLSSYLCICIVLYHIYLYSKTLFFERVWGYLSDNL